MTYVDFHLLVQLEIHDQAVRHPNAMRLHRMSCHIGIIAHIGVVEVCDSLLLACGRSGRLQVDRCEIGHFVWAQSPPSCSCRW